MPETKFKLKIHLDDSANDAKPMIKRHTNETYRLTISYRYNLIIKVIQNRSKMVSDNLTAMQRRF